MTAKGKKTAGANGKPVGDPQDRLLADVEILRTSEPMSEVYHDAQARCLRALPQLLALLAQREGDLARWERLFLDKPEDRLFHASDKTWWQRKDDTYLGKGGLFSAAPPEYVQRLEDDLSFVRTELARVKAEYEELLASKKRALEMLKRAQAPQVERFMTATATMPAERQVEPATPATGRTTVTAYLPDGERVDAELTEAQVAVLRFLSGLPRQCARSVRGDRLDLPTARHLYRLELVIVDESEDEWDCGLTDRGQAIVAVLGDGA